MQAWHEMSPKHGPPTFLWQSATPIIVGWYAGRKWEQQVVYITGYIFFCNFYSKYMISKAAFNKKKHPFHRQSELKFKKETSKMLYLEH